MLPKKQRIPRKHFSLLKQAKASSNEMFLVRFAPSFSEGSRFCFSAGKKIAKKAVLRNRMRRVGYRIIAGLIPSIRRGFLIHVSFRAVPINEEDAKQSLSQVLKKSGLIK
jgi:RNase P protein component